MAFELQNGPIPLGLTVDHTCHTPTCTADVEACDHRRCCNPAHMVLATTAENCAPLRRRVRRTVAA